MNDNNETNDVAGRHYENLWNLDSRDRILLAANSMQSVLSGAGRVQFSARKNKKKQLLESLEISLNTPDDIYDLVEKISGKRLDTEITNPEGLDFVKFLGNRNLSREVGFVSERDAATSVRDSNDSFKDWIGNSQKYNLKDSFSYRHAGLVMKSPTGLAELARFLIDQGYKACYDICLRFDNKNRPVAAFEFDDGKITIVEESKDKIAKIALKIAELTYEKVGDTKITTIVGVGPMGLQTRTEEVSPDTVKLATSAFYPWMNGVTVQEYFNEFLMSSANVMVLYGRPGTAKSTMIQTAIATLGISTLICADAAVSSNPEFVSKLGAKASEDSEKGEGYDLIVVEDGDVLMLPRSQGNVGLSSLLTATDGIGNKGKFKLVITSNATDTSQIDPALLRPGRCFDVNEFPNLLPDEANAARVSIGLPVRAFTKPLTLAAALNSDVATMKSDFDENIAIVKPRYPIQQYEKRNEN